MTIPGASKVTPPHSPPVQKPSPPPASGNRERVLAAAAETFAKQGLDAPMPAIARAAGVGVGTVYRHFPTKEALVGALADRHFAHIAELAEAALRREDDPWAAFEDVIWESGRLFAADRGLAEIAANHPEAMKTAKNRSGRLRELSGRLLERARDAGRMRPDATVEDLETVMCALGGVVAVEASGARGVCWQRYLTIALDGLKAR